MKMMNTNQIGNVSGVKEKPILTITDFILYLTIAYEKQGFIKTFMGLCVGIAITKCLTVNHRTG